MVQGEFREDKGIIYIYIEREEGNNIKQQREATKKVVNGDLNTWGWCPGVLDFAVEPLKAG